MYNREFFRTKLGLAAMVSIAAMIGVNLIALNQQLQADPAPLAIAAAAVELA